MTIGRMKQRVAVALAAVWLASIVGASVPSGETTTFSNPRSSGPSPDQYTPSHRNPRSYLEDEEYRQDWMNDEPPRIRVPDRGEKFTPVKDLRRPGGSSPESDGRYGIMERRLFEIFGNSEERNPSKLEDIEKDDELDNAEAMRLSSIKVAFDEPIVSDESEEDWEGEELEDETMHRDDFLADDPFEDEGPGSVEVYKLDLSRERPSLGVQTQPRKTNVRYKSKVPKKVGAYDQMIFKTKSSEASESKSTNHVSKSAKLDEFSASSRSLKDRIFGVGGVPELQVGCEGTEVSQRQKRSDIEDTNKPVMPTVPLLIEPDYDSDEYLDLTNDAGKVAYLQKLATSGYSGRGDMDPRIKSPGELEAKRLLRKDNFPTRGDLGTSANPNVTEMLGSRTYPHRRQVSFVEEEKFETKTRSKRSEPWGYSEEEKPLGYKKKHRHNKQWCKRNKNDPRCKWGRNKGKIVGRIIRKNGKPNDKTPRKFRGKNGNLLRKLDMKGRRRTFENITDRRRQHSLQLQHDQPDESPKDDVNQKYLEKFIKQMTPKVRPDINNLSNGEGKDNSPREIRLPDKTIGKLEPGKGKPVPVETDLVRLSYWKTLPTKAVIKIFDEKKSVNRTETPPVIANRYNPKDFRGLEPAESGPSVPGFPVPNQSSDLIPGPPGCALAITNCCGKKRLTNCLEGYDCIGAHWDYELCSAERKSAALAEINTYYQNLKS
ncbi:uncharacterized protein LOC124181310 isoform X1 [Neodiprion fabricii]|uniref:uncharacterized protein LOC124181310 isoform X1 n=1 Tax=Neodiprion fabricii TaxID=2872261 RepID=UPI001ED93D56|nr:uncharacterized protein LOC124181310 isoform X1 [Neodiprion fabricii]